MGRHAGGTARLPESGVVFRPTRRDIDPSTGEPTAHALWDRHAWEPSGRCWLWCGRPDVEVTWIGPVCSSGMHADLYSCRSCLYELDQRVLESNIRRDIAALPVTPSTPAPRRP
ncbi:hypothetical protein H8N00_12170 [Streptomyces sp. AC563]|nr:hypothetical protein [Streptomyces buecherae]